MSDLSISGWALCLAAADAAAITVLVLLIRHQARTQAEALDDARHEFETGLAFLDSRLRVQRRPHTNLPPIDDEGT